MASQYYGVRDYLYGVRDLFLSMNYCKLKIQDLKTQSESITAKMTGMPGGGGGDVHKDAVLAALADQKSKYEQMELEYLHKIEEVNAFIDEVPRTVDRLILRLRYVDCLKWEEIQEELHKCEHGNRWYSLRHITRLHGDAIRSAEKIWEQRKDTL